MSVSIASPPSLGGTLIGALPIFNARKFTGGRKGVALHHHEGRGHSWYRPPKGQVVLEWFSQGDDKRASATIVQTGPSCPSPYSADFSQFIDAVCECGALVEEPGTPYQFQFTLNLQAFGIGYAELVRNTLDQRVEQPEGSHRLQNSGILVFHDGRSSTAYVEFSNELRHFGPKLVRVVITTYELLALKETLAKLLVAFRPHYSREALREQSWGVAELTELYNLWFNGDTWTSYPITLAENENGFHVFMPFAPPPYWLAVPDEAVKTGKDRGHRTIRIDEGHVSNGDDAHPCADFVAKLQERRFVLRRSATWPWNRALFAEWVS